MPNGKKFFLDRVLQSFEMVIYLELSTFGLDIERCLTGLLMMQSHLDARHQGQATLKSLAMLDVTFKSTALGPYEASVYIIEMQQLLDWT
jgi:hypothetical protein